MYMYHKKIKKKQVVLIAYLGKVCIDKAQDWKKYGTKYFLPMYINYWYYADLLLVRKGMRNH